DIERSTKGARMPTANVNILAVIVAAVATFVLGAVWYSPVLFAKQWMQAHGYTPEQLEAMKRRGVARAYAVSALCYLVMAYALEPALDRDRERKLDRHGSVHGPVVPEVNTRMRRASSADSSSRRASV